MNDNYDDELQQNHSENEDKKKKIKLILIFIIVFVVVFCGVYFGIQLYYNQSEPTTAPSTAPSTSQTAEELADNPIDFTSLQSQNTDIYAWIQVDGTKIDYPIVQHTEDDSFYLKHDAYTKSWADKGAVYTEMINHKSFSDPITVIYGHNGYGDTMFTTLHYFEKSDFFNEHSEFVIYAKGRKLTYQIISAFKYDDRHILNSFNFADTAVLEDFLSFIQNPDSAVKNVRQQLDTTIDKDSNIVILSTCITNQKSNRYLVCGVLVKDEKTN